MPKVTVKCDEGVEVSDGYHTFSELYEHRCQLFIALCRVIRCFEICWRSRLHNDGTSFAGWFILGLQTEPGEQITYHLPDRLWPQTEFAQTLERGPAFDGHTPADVLARIARLT